MKTLILILFVSLNGFSQATLHELLDWHSKYHREVKAHFEASNWSVINDTYSEQAKTGQINLSSTQRPSALTINFDIFFEPSISQNRFFLRTKNKEWFDKVKSEIESLGLKFISRKTTPEASTVVYRNDNVTVEIATERGIGVAPSYYQVNIVGNAYEKPSRFNLKKE